MDGHAPVNMEREKEKPDDLQDLTIDPGISNHGAAMATPTSPAVAVC